jgi:magnesium-transporting ATPase (P-type)
MRCRAAGITVAMVTGDPPGNTANTIAMKRESPRHGTSMVTRVRN